MKSTKDHSWHSLSVEDAVKAQECDIKRGLTTDKVKERLRKFGPNALPEETTASKLQIFINQFKSPLIYILIIAGIITLALGKWTDSIVILGAVLINAVFGYWEENKTSRILEKLKKILEAKAIVLRDGHKIEILQQDLVPGDIIFLKAGDKVPADGRLIEVQNLKIDESILTGEWIPADKHKGILPETTPLADRDNMVYMGCLVEHGEGKAIVVGTGIDTEAGKIAALVRESREEKTPLQKKLVGFSKVIGITIGVICVFIFVGGFLRAGDLLEMFETAVAIAVGGIPEALPVVMTVVLTIGMERILRKKGLVRRLSSVETLGSTQIICFDKTKTLTEGKMVVQQIKAQDKDLALKISVLCNEAFVENPEDPPESWKLVGSPTDKALLSFAAKLGMTREALEKESIEITRLPFDPYHKYLLSLRKEGDKTFLYVSGAPERILRKSQDAEQHERTLEDLTRKGLRVIGAACREISDKEAQNPDLIDLVKDMTFAGFFGLRDPLRKEVKDAVRVCQRAGMRPIMITGDHKLTARAIAVEIGLQVEDDNIIVGDELSSLSDEEFENRLDNIKIYARAEPQHKMRVIQAWQKRGKVVGMTGDGVNDAPALKKADIGISLGSGTEVAKESSDLVLLNDSFGIIIKSIEEGRVILDNLRKAISYALADSFTSIILVGIATVILGWPLPILPVQILWNNFVEDTMPNIAYSFEPEEDDVMQRKPPPPDAPLLNKQMKVLIFGTGFVDQIIALALFWYIWKNLGLDLSYARTMVFGAICIDTAFVIYCYKSLRKNIWKINLFSNKWLNLSSIVVIVTFAMAIYLPPLQRILHTVPLDAMSWLVLLAIGIASMFLIEVTKWVFITRHQTD